MAGIVRPERDSSQQRLFSPTAIGELQMASLMVRAGVEHHQMRNLIDAWQELRHATPGRGMYEQARRRLSSYRHDVGNHADSCAAATLQILLDAALRNVQRTGSVPPLAAALRAAAMAHEASAEANG